MRLDKDVESWIFPAELLLFMRLVSSISASAYIAIGIYQMRWFYFNELFGWNWISLLIYFTTATFKSFYHVQGLAPQRFMSPYVFRCLLTIVSGISLQLILVYWLLLPSIPITENPIMFIGYNLGLLLVMVENIMSRVQIEFLMAIVTSPITLVYVLWTWFTAYVLNWEFPIPAMKEHLQYTISAYPLLPNLALVVFINIAASLIIFITCITRDYLGHHNSGHATKHSVPV